MTLKPIPDFPGYSVSSNGWVQSDYRFVVRTMADGSSHPKEIKARILKPAVNGRGYLFVTLRKGNKAHTMNVHRLIALAFLGPRPKGKVVHHKDNNKQNNALDNLEYTTRQRNTQEYYSAKGSRLGVIPIGHIPQIAERVHAGESIYRIAKEYNVTRNDLATITRVIALTGEELTIKDDGKKEGKEEKADREVDRRNMGS